MRVAAQVWRRGPREQRPRGPPAGGGKSSKPKEHKGHCSGHERRRAATATTTIRNGWKVVQTRWIDINKGDDEKPKYRSIFVGKEFNNEPVEGMFGETPLLEALRYLIHEAATVRSGVEGDHD